MIIGSGCDHWVMAYEHYYILPPAGCRVPPSPVKGSIEEYRSTEEGAEIQFHCHDGYTPNEWMSSQCLNSSWSPHPMDLVCTEINTSTILPPLGRPRFYDQHFYHDKQPVFIFVLLYTQNS